MRIKQKIIISSYDDLNNPYYAGGGARAIHSIAKRLVKKYRIVVIASKFPGAKDEVIDEVRYKRIGLSFAGPKIGQLIYQLFLLKSILSEEFDLWVESFTPPFSTSFLPIFTKKPVIGLVHMLSGEDMVRKYKLPFNIVESLGLKLYEYFIVVNKETKKKILTKNPKAHIFVIPNGVDLANPGRIKNGLRKHILFIGRIEINQKGLDLLLNAYKLIADKVKQRLIIAGAGTEQEIRRLRKLITELTLTKRVQLVGRIKGREWEKIFKGAFVVVIPSRYETFSLVALEAISFGVPVVAFDIEGLKWLPRSVSLKAKKFNFKQLGNLILRLTDNSIERKKLSRNMPNFLTKYSWEKICHEYTKVFHSILIAK